MQPQQVEADCLERPHGVVEALLHEVALHLEVGDDPPAPRLDRSIPLSPSLFPFSCVGQDLLQLLEPAPHFLRVLFQPVHHGRQVAELLARVLRQRREQLLRRHPERELRGSMRHRRGQRLGGGERARQAE